MMKKIDRFALFAAVFVAALALGAAPAMGQPGYGGQGAAPQGMQTQQPAAQDFDEATLKKFAEASVALGEIQNKFAEKLKSVQDQETATAMQRQMHDEMVNAVQGKGLEVRTYNAIANKMSVDEEFRNKVEQMK